MLFFTDLDNTMIYSHRHSTDAPVIWVEELHERKQSYMTEYTYSFFMHQAKLKMIPLTTRTKEQYMRLHDSLSNLGWNEALICNGAIRLLNGREDQKWTMESVRLSEMDRPYYIELLNEVKKDYPEDALVVVDPFLFYIKTDCAEKTYEKLLEKADASHLIIMRDSRKVYCIPKSLEKGTAVERYRKTYEKNPVIAAGDSVFDLSMLKSADSFFYPETLSEYFLGEAGIKCSGRFSDDICRHLIKICSNVKEL